MIEIELVNVPRACIGIFMTTFTLEEELNLKAQMQKLLTVAKNLFTHLGEKILSLVRIF